MRGYSIKQEPEDFVVKEIPGVRVVENGEYSIFRLKKRNYTTERAVQLIADALKIDRKRIGYAGNKDKVAVTEQSISIRNIKKRRVENLKLRDIELSFIGYSDEPVSLGDLEGNHFEIVARNIEKPPRRVERIINYFGEQRFSRYNAEIGKAIIKKEFRKAVDRILDSIGKDEERVIEHLRRNKNDFVGALKRMPWKTLNLYVHAYQSKLWNKVVEELIMRNKDFLACDARNTRIPLIGFATEIKEKNIKRVVDEVLEEEGITQDDFIIRAIPELSSAGSERDLFAEVKELKIGELEEDELNRGKKKVRISFSLGKGSYATEVVKALFS